MHTHPTIPLQKLLNSRPVNYPLDKYQQPWREIFTALQSAPAKPQVRQAALKAAVAALSDTALALLDHTLKDPLALAHHIPLTDRQREIIIAVIALGSAQTSTIARTLSCDRSNTFRRLQTLVSLGILARRKSGWNVYYHLPVESPSQPEE